jgi:hypothetical protein
VLDDLMKKRLTKSLETLLEGAEGGVLKAVFTVAVTETGSSQVIYVEPEDREELISAINVELSKMLGEPHHIVSTERLERFFKQQNISNADLIRFRSTEPD